MTGCLKVTEGVAESSVWVSVNEASFIEKGFAIEQSTEEQEFTIVTAMVSTYASQALDAQFLQVNLNS